MMAEDGWWIIVDDGVTVGVVTENPDSATPNAIGVRVVQGWNVIVPGREFVRVVRAGEGDEP